MKLAIRIQHHPKRKRYLKILLSLLDKKNNLKIIEDNISTWSGCQKCIKSVNNEYSHILILQDDIIVCKDFIKTAEKIMKLNIEPITFFSNLEIIRQAKVFNTNWVKINVWFMAQAYMMTRELANQFLEWSNKHCKPILVDDERLGMFFYYKKQQVWATSPTLVDHIGWSDTTIGIRDNFSYKKINNRVSQYFIGLENSGLSIDWEKSINNPLIDKITDNDLFIENYIP